MKTCLSRGFRPGPTQTGLITTEDGYRLEILDLGSLGVALHIAKTYQPNTPEYFDNQNRKKLDHYCEKPCVFVVLVQLMFKPARTDTYRH